MGRPKAAHMIEKTRLEWVIAVRGHASTKDPSMDLNIAQREREPLASYF
jgi:hypothetical protein